MKNIVVLLFVAILLSSCEKEPDFNLDAIHGQWFVFSEERRSATGNTSIDTLYTREEYFEFRADKSFFSTADGSGFYEISRDSVHISFRRRDDEDYRHFGFQYKVDATDLALSEGNVTLHMKRL